MRLSSPSIAARFPPISSKPNCSATSAAPSPGAARQHQGYFERATGGTLFLDEITGNAARSADEAAARARIRAHGPRGRHRGDPDRRSRPDGDQSRAGDDHPRPAAARGSLLSPRRVRRAPAAAAATRRRHPAAGAGFPRPAESANTERTRSSIRPASRSRGRILGRETFASSRTASSAASSFPTTSSRWICIRSVTSRPKALTCASASAFPSA